LSTLLHTGLGELLPDLQQKLEEEGFRLQAYRGSDGDDGLATGDLLVIGPGEPQPVRVVQQVHAQDRYISTVLLTLPEQFSRVKQSLQFAPFVGKNTQCVAFTRTLDIATTFRQAAQRTRQRRSFSRISKVPRLATSIASSAVKVEHLGTLLEQAPISALLVDDENRVLALNQKARQLFRTDEEKLYTLPDLLPSATIQQLKLSLAAAHNGPRVWTANDRILEVHLSAVQNEQGRAQNILLVNDITEQKAKEAALQESEALFRFMAEAMPQKVWTADAQGELNFFNQHWTTYTGRSAKELKGWGWIDSIHPEDAARNRAAWQRAIDTGEDFGFEQRIRRYDGEYRWHLVRGVARKDAAGRILMWIGTNTDIHEQKAFAEELEKRVKERTYELEKSNSELEQFVYVTSHDLQEPLRKIRMFSELLNSSWATIDETSKRHLEKVNNTAQRMSTLLKELLNFTQLSREELYKPTDLNTIVSKVLLDLELVIGQKRADLQVDPLPVLEAVPVQMHQLFYNLVNNALKFSKAGVPPVVRISARTAEPAQVARYPHLHKDRIYYEIVVADNGIGFDQSYAEQIFHIFQRLHTRTEYSGTGIGLALCKKVVTNHYGVIYAEGEKGRGAAFHVLLPAHGEARTS
jgi:PAS domain S-box-containing protein